MSKMSSLVSIKIHEMLLNDSDTDTPDKNRRNKVCQDNRIINSCLNSLEHSDDDDDEEENYNGNDNLNCAILDQSFVSSPSCDPDLIKTPAPGQTTDNNDDHDENESVSRNWMNLNSKSAVTESNDSGFISRVNNTGIDCHDGKSQTATKFPYRTTSKTRLQLFSEDSTPSEKNSAQQKPVLTPSSVFQNDPIRKPVVPVRRPFLDTRLPKSSFIKCLANEEVKETPFKSSQDHFNFITPSNPLSTVVSNNSSSLLKSAHDHKKKVIVYSTPSTHKKLSPLREAPKATIDEKVLRINHKEYLIEKKIGSGGSSVVHLAKDRLTGKEFAIKTVSLDGDEQMIEGYLNETKLLARLQGNVNVIKLFDYCHQPESKRLFMVMEKGENDLQRVLQAHRNQLPLHHLMNYWHQMLQAVNYIHQNRVVHSDLKPANFLMIGGRLKLIDFGIASNISSDSTSIIKFSQAGTFNYISPEALIDTSTGESPMRSNQPRIRISTRSDVWSLGCILYLLIYMKTPFSHIKLLPQKISAIANPKTVIEYLPLPNFYPPILFEMLKKCLVYDPKQRSSVAELLAFPFHMVIPVDNQQ